MLAPEVEEVVMEPMPEVVVEEQVEIGEPLNQQLLVGEVVRPSPS